MMRWSGAQVRDGLLLALTLVAGCLDAVGYIGLGRVFTANMTGNLVLLGVSAGQGQLASTLRSVAALVGFALGALIGGRATGSERPSGDWPRRVTGALVLEAVLLAVFVVGWRLVPEDAPDRLLDLLVGVLAAAMGLQSAAARHMAVSGVTTTYVTGTLTSLMTELAALAAPSGWHRWLQVLVALLAGATLGAVAMAAWREWAPLVPMVILIGVVLVAEVRFVEPQAQV
jgi:uncharacterized membrane protein YoaK (UPF0700 family)